MGNVSQFLTKHHTEKGYWGV